MPRAFAATARASSSDRGRKSRISFYQISPKTEETERNISKFQNLSTRSGSSG